MGKNKGKKKGKGPESGDAGPSSQPSQQQPQIQQQQQHPQTFQEPQQPSRGKKKGKGPESGDAGPSSQPSQQKQQPSQESQQPLRGKTHEKGSRQERGDASSHPQSQQFPQLQPQQHYGATQQQSWPRGPQKRDDMGGGDGPQQPQQQTLGGRGRGGPPPGRGRGAALQQHQPQQQAPQQGRGQRDPPGFHRPPQEQQAPPGFPQQQQQPVWGPRGPPGFQRPPQEQQAPPQQQQQQPVWGGPRGSPPRFQRPPQEQQAPAGFPQQPMRGQRGSPSQEQLSMQMQRQPASSDISSATRQQPTRGTPPPSSRPVPSTQQTSAGASMGKGDTVPVEEVTKRMSTLMEVALPKRDAAKRPKKEGRGRHTKLDTNHLALAIKDPKATVYHYDVAVNPERPFKFYRPALSRMREMYYPNFYPAFDGKKNLYSIRKLPFNDEGLEGRVSIWDDRRDKEIEIEVKIKFANAVKLSTISDYLRSGSSTNSPQEALQALDVVLRSPAAERFVQVGRSFFSPPKGRIISLTGGLDLWYGFYQSAIIGWKPFLNIDVAHKGFPAADNCIDLLCDFLRVNRGQLNRNSEPDRRGIEEFKSFILTLRVTYEIMKGSAPVKRTYRVIGLSACPRGNKFSCNGKQITVEEYFRQEYRYNIQYPLVPCLECGSKEKPISLPMELCRVIEGQNVNRKLNDEQTRNMVKEAAVSTDMRRRKIEGSIRDVKFNNDPYVKDFGLTVTTQFTEVDARILNPPSLLYNNQKVIPVEKGVWRTDRFISSYPLSKWGILCANRFVRREKLQEFADSLQRGARQVGMQIAPPTFIDACDHIRDLVNYLKEWKEKSYQLAVVVLPDRGPISYAKVKQIAEQDVGILTQCLKSKTLQKLSSATVTNILLKVNSKHNGINHNITCTIWEKYFKKPVIVFGADVTHPAPGQLNVPSVAAVAASFEPKAFSYNMEWRFQPPREEMILDLEEIVIKQLKAFYRHNSNLKPERILFYRDGVSEGQFRKVLETELRAIRSACAKLGAEYKPPITFLVVQKRHHTRFFPTRPEDADGKNRNVPAGTVVDTFITHMSEIDFYLVSHASIQGTSRPTKYHVLWDDANMSEDDIEEITYYLCHLFTRCTRAVSYPAPTYYAHLAAFRIRSYYEDQNIAIHDLQGEQQRKRIKEDLLRNSPMFFV